MFKMFKIIWVNNFYINKKLVLYHLKLFIIVKHFHNILTYSTHVIINKNHIYWLIFVSFEFLIFNPVPIQT